jgi:hypothetical protein
MATTATNKQPLLVDRVLHEVVDTNLAYNQGLDVVGTNSARLLINCIGTDGAIIEYIYAIARGTTEYVLNFYLSSNNDYLRPTESSFIGSLTSATTAKTVTEFTLPKCLTPVPRTGDDAKNTALYLPSNKALWVARDGNVDVSDGPLVGAQGGYY